MSTTIKVDPAPTPMPTDGTRGPCEWCGTRTTRRAYANGNGIIGPIHECRSCAALVEGKR